MASTVIPTPRALRRGMVRVRAVVVGAGLVLASPIVLAGCGGKGTSAAAPTTTVTHHVRRLPANAVRIHWKNKALVPATRAGQVCIVTYKTGRFCAGYVVGEIPAVALRAKLRAKGWVVVRSN
jgi:hypothetical protein